MDPVISTPRLKLTLVTTAERGSPELSWLHELRSNEKVTLWSIYGQSKSIEDTEKAVKGYLPTSEGKAGSHRIMYAVHSILDQKPDSVGAGAHPNGPETQATEFVGLVTLRTLEEGALALPEDLTIPAAATASTLVLELAYMFLPSGWGKGYATESVGAVLAACKRARSVWQPFSKLYVRAIVNQGNPISMRVMDKVGMPKRGIYEWTGRIFLAGEWRTEDKLHIYGTHLLE